jgi:hypothetical protein
MHRVMRVGRSGCALLLAAGLMSLFPGQAHAQFGRPNPFLNPFLNPFINPLFDQFGNQVFPMGNGIGNGGPQGVTRATSSLANPINFYQHGQITGVGPIRGTVRIYNQFGLAGMDQSQNDPFGLGLGGNNNQLPGQGNTDGDDGPQGVLLHVNYANMFLPNQQQINGNGVGGGFGRPFGGFGGGFGFGGLGGFGGGFPGGFGKGAFGNGSRGL